MYFLTIVAMSEDACFVSAARQWISKICSELAGSAWLTGEEGDPRPADCRKHTVRTHGLELHCESQLKI